MLSSHLPEWQLQFGVTRMLSSSHLFCALWWRQDSTEQWMVWLFMMVSSLFESFERMLSA